MRCQVCDKELVGRQKKFCGDRCFERARKRAKRARAEAMPKPEVSALATTRRVLEEADRLETPAGANAMLLAAKLDACTDTGSAMAALSKQHLAALEAATKNATTTRTELDELRERRAARLRSA